MHQKEFQKREHLGMPRMDQFVLYLFARQVAMQILQIFPIMLRLNLLPDTSPFRVFITVVAVICVVRRMLNRSRGTIV